MILDNLRPSLVPPSGISTAEWVERHRVLSVLTSATAGRYSLAMVPFFRPILAAMDDEDVEVVVIQKPSQIGATELLVSWLGRVAAEDPGPAMMVLADEQTSAEICERRIQPMMRSSPPLAPLVIPAKMGQEGIELRNAFTLTMAWASSIARTASRPIRYLLLDEICKPGYSLLGAEGAVIERCQERTETFPNAKQIMGSSPTVEGDNLEKQMASCDVVYEYCVPCPYCGLEQPLRFRPTKIMLNGAEIVTGCVVWDNDQENIQAKAETARYQCGGCEAQWTTTEKNTAVGLGRSVPRVPPTRKPRKVGFHLNRIMSLFPGGRLETLVSDFLASKDDPLRLQVFTNNALGEHWVDRIGGIITDVSLMAARLPELAPRTVPEEALVLTAGVDVQKSGFWFLVRAWSRDQTSWLVDYGYLPTWAEVDGMLFGGGYGFPIWRALIDTGGGVRQDGDQTSTEEVYQWLRRNAVGRGVQVFGSKGSSSALSGNIQVGPAKEKTPAGKPLPGGIRIVSIDTDKMKDAYWYRIGLAAEHRAGAAYLHRDVDQNYVRQILAEEKRRDKRGIVEWVQVSRDNHLLDCEVMAFAAADYELFGGMRMVRARPVMVQRQAPKPSEPQQQRQDRAPNPWLAGVANPSLFGG